MPIPEESFGCKLDFIDIRMATGSPAAPGVLDILGRSGSSRSPDSSLHLEVIQVNQVYSPGHLDFQSSGDLEFGAKRGIEKETVLQTY